MMKKSILNLGKILNTAAQKEISGGTADATCTLELYVGAPCRQGHGVCLLPYPNASYLICSPYNPFLDM